MRQSNVAYRDSGSAAARAAALKKLDALYPDMVDLGKAAEIISANLGRTITRGYLQQICAPKCENIGTIITSPTGFFKKMLTKEEVAVVTSIIRNMTPRCSKDRTSVASNPSARLTVEQMKALIGHELDKLITPVVVASEAAEQKAETAASEISMLAAANERLIARVEAYEGQIEILKASLKDAQNQERWALASFKTANDALATAKMHIKELLAFATND